MKRGRASISRAADGIPFQEPSEGWKLAAGQAHSFWQNVHSGQRAAIC